MDKDQKTQPPPSPYNHAAAGWGALWSSLAQVVRNRGVLRNTISLLHVNQHDGFDCPGCAWPEPAHPSGMAEYCENGVKAVTFETTARRVTPAFFAEHTVSWLRQQTGHWLENQGRLTEPLYYQRDQDRYRPICWDDAFRMIGNQLRSLSSPDQSLFYTSGRTSNEAAFLYQLFARRFGTNNLPDCSNMCHESSGYALSESIGVGKGTVTLDDFEHADTIFVIGQNPGTNHPRMLTELEKAARRGARIITLNPLREPGLVRFTHPKHVVQMLFGRGTPISSHYYQLLIGGDLAALKGICKWVLEAESAAPGTVLDHHFIQQHTSGLAEFSTDLANVSWVDIEKESGLTRAQIAEIAEVYRTSSRVIACWAMGLTQHRHAVATIQYVVNLLLLRGNLGKTGAGLCPVRGHSNVQGDRTMGISEKPAESFLEGLRQTFGFEPPHHHGHDVVAAITAMMNGHAQVFIGLGGNFAAASPDTELTEAALSRCSLTVQISTKLNRSHLVPGKDALILPCLGRSERDTTGGREQFVTVEDSMSQVHASRGRNQPASPLLRSEVAIVAGMARATLGDNSGIDWAGLEQNYALIRDKIEAVLPDLFFKFNTRIQVPGGFYLGNNARALHFRTATGKARFMTHPLPQLHLPAGQLRLMTIRSHDQYNTTIYALNDRYRGVYGTRYVLFMNAEDVAERSLRDGQSVTISSHCPEDAITRKAAHFRIVVFDIPKGCAAAYFPETNVLLSKDSYASGSRTPLSKFIPITVAASEADRGSV